MSLEDDWKDVRPVTEPAMETAPETKPTIEAVLVALATLAEVEGIECAPRFQITVNSVNNLWHIQSVNSPTFDGALENLLDQIARLTNNKVDAAQRERNALLEQFEASDEKLKQLKEVVRQARDPLRKR